MVHRGEIYLVDLHDNVGSEQGGVRPAVIVQNDTGNNNSPTTIVCPLTSRQKKNIPTHVDLMAQECHLLVDSTVLCEQVRVIDRARIKRKLGEVNNKEKIEDINRKIMIAFGL